MNTVNRRKFIAGVGAVVGTALAPTAAIGAITSNKSRAWTHMLQMGSDDDIHVRAYVADNAVAWFGYSADGYPHRVLLESRESYDEKIEDGWDEMEEFLESVREHKEDVSGIRPIVTTRDHRLVSGQYEMTEDNVDYFLENFEHSATFSSSCTFYSPEKYAEWHTIKNTRSDAEFRAWANETYQANI